MFKSLVISCLASLALTGAASAQAATPAGTAAAPVCGPRAALVILLKQQFGELQEDAALQSDQTLIELFASERGTWSIVLSAPNGTSCIVSAGNGLLAQARS